MIVGIGIDVVDIDRFERTLARTPRLRERLFSVAERDLPPRSLAARYAAKEPLIKALGGFSGATWHDMRVRQEASGKPDFEMSGALATRVASFRFARFHLSTTDDAGIASAFVVLQ